MTRSLLAVLWTGMMGLSASVMAQPATALSSTKPSPVREVIVIIKTHFDIGYTHRVKEIVRYCRTDMIDRAMDIMDQSKLLPPEQQFAWTAPAWVMAKVLDDWDGQTAVRRQRLDDYVRAGKFRFHALPFTLESDGCEPEAMARGFSFASDLSRRYGMPLPRSGKMLLYGEHTWGGAASVKQYGDTFHRLDPRNYADLEASWEDKTDYIRDAARITCGILTNDLQTVAGAVQGETPCLVVYNPLPWTRSGYVDFKGERVFVKDVPPSGYRCQRLPFARLRSTPRRTTESTTLENAFFKLTVDPGRGALTSLVDKWTGREWVMRPALAASGVT